jgi:hypothetical protein
LQAATGPDETGTLPKYRQQLHQTHDWSLIASSQTQKNPETLLLSCRQPTEIENGHATTLHLAISQGCCSYFAVFTKAAASSKSAGYQKGKEKCSNAIISILRTAMKDSTFPHFIKISNCQHAFELYMSALLL